ncbi:hypothetical protein ACH5RR_021718 [Cinchona calisaya]|uniref:Uncharacterized protein n=1 Tax=Cinchona calisaya TaxID=153742 RepID=A0ABD2ZIY4_9GENT
MRTKKPAPGKPGDCNEMADEAIECTVLATFNTVPNMPKNNEPHPQAFEATFSPQFGTDDHGSGRHRITPLSYLPKSLCPDDGNQGVDKKKYRHEANRIWKTKRLHHMRLASQSLTNLGSTKRKANSLPESSQLEYYSCKPNRAEKILKWKAKKAKFSASVARTSLHSQHTTTMKNTYHNFHRTTQALVVGDQMPGITLTDVTGQINAFICSPDTEKLIPYSAIELKEADNQVEMAFGWGGYLYSFLIMITEYTLTLELAESIAKHAIICFVRYYEQDNHGNKESGYSIAKAYTTKELLQASHMHTDEESTLVDSENIVEIDKTLATATTKNVGPSMLPLTPTQYSAEASPSKKPRT